MVGLQHLTEKVVGGGILLAYREWREFDFFEVVADIAGQELFDQAPEFHLVGRGELAKAFYWNSDAKRECTRVPPSTE
jgi:hypothetical protein